MRLDKFIANNSDYSRSDLKHLARQGAITVNGAVVKSTATKITTNDAIRVNNALIAEIGLIYIMLNKPAGIVCANSDAEHPTVIDLLYQAQLPFDADILALSPLQIVGRLDRDTTGLVLLTNDGQWNHTVTSPAHHCDKRYRVTVSETIDSDTVKTFQSCIKLKGEKTPCRPAQLSDIDGAKATITISEGRYHQIKRMFASVGNPVTALHRFQIGRILLPATLGEGEVRHLSPDEIDSVYGK